MVSPENAPCSLVSERATTHALGRLPLWPVLPRPRMAGFEVSTEALPHRRPRGEIVTYVSGTHIPTNPPSIYLL